MLIFEKILKENSGLLSRMKIRDGNELLNKICEESFKKELTNSHKQSIIKVQREKEEKTMDEKAKRLANIMFQEDEYRDANDMELMYHTKEDFEAEKKEREEKKMKKKVETIGIISGADLLKKSRPIQDIPFRTGVYQNKKKKREKVNKNHLDKWMQELYNLLVRVEKGVNNMTEKQINDIIDELNNIKEGFEWLMNYYPYVEELIGKFTAMLPDAEPEKEFFEFMDDETGEVFVVYTTNVVTARSILREEGIENVSFQKVISEEEVNTVGFDYWEQKEKRYASIFF